ncbi:MAG: OmpA family protein [Methylococcales bacterium]|nr:OmpA family protein [Methylococcales bacterium]
MRKTFLTAIIGTILVLTGCAISKTTDESHLFSDKTEFQSVKVDSIAEYITSGKYVQRANNLFVLFDASSSATEDYLGVGYKTKNNEPTKLEAQREILHRMNQTLYNSASALRLSDFTTGIRSFGYGKCDGYGDRSTDLHQAATLYSKEAFDQATDTIACAHGRSNIAKVLIKNDNTSNPVSNMLGNDIDKSVDDDLAATKGNISLVIISDLSKGKLARAAAAMLPEYLNPDLGEDDQQAIKSLRQKYGDRLCVYNVWMGSSSKSQAEDNSHESEDFSERELMYSADNPANCGGPSAYNAERVAEADGMKDFMRAALLSPVPPAPAIDCSQLDSDGDGVNDCNDKCPNTIKGTPVNRLGCWIVDVKFDNDRSVIKPQYFALLDKLATDITANFANLTIEVQGHTSNTASAAHNLKLSVRRANAVADYLNKRIRGPHKLVPHGYGLTRPIDTNETEAGRANNRRVQLEVLQ